MNKRLISKSVKEIIHQSLHVYRQIIPYRDNRLFTEFLPKGYCYMTLTSVDDCFYDQVLSAKFHLGMLITLLDDFADHPRYFNPLLLEQIYKIPYSQQHINDSQLSHADDLIILHLVKYLFQQIECNLKPLPHYASLKNILKFDLMRFYQANQYSELIMRHAEIVNTYELLQLRPFNMGMVIAGMMDVIASSQFNLSELGVTRKMLHLGQRYGSISNNLNTFSRELAEGDITNEVLIKGLDRQLIIYADLKQLSYTEIRDKLHNIIAEMEKEQNEILNELIQEKFKINSFDCNQYVNGLKQLKLLHQSMQGII